MSLNLYSSAGCLRCTIVKNFLSQHNMPFIEHDIQTEAGNTAFKRFYAQNRAHIKRDSHGIFFPLLQDKEKILQDAGSTLAWFVAKKNLQHMIFPNSLGHGWTGGLDLSHGEPAMYEAFMQVVRLLKKGGLQTEIHTNGNNALLLCELMAEKLVDRLQVHVLPPEMAPDTCKSSCEDSFRAAQAAMCTLEVHYYTDVAITNATKGAACQAQDIAAAAHWLYDATGDNTLPYTIRNSDSVQDARSLLPLRTAARRWQVKTEVCTPTAAI